MRTSHRRMQVVPHHHQHPVDPISMELPKGGAIVQYSLRFLGLRLRLAFTKRRFDEVEAIYRSHVEDDEYEQARLATLLSVFEASFSSLRNQILEIEKGQEIIKKKIIPRVQAQFEMHRSFLVFLQGFRDTEAENNSDRECMEQERRNPSKCLLPMLNVGEETTSAIKQLISDFAGIPTRGTLHDLRSLKSMLEKTGPQDYGRWSPG